MNQSSTTQPAETPVIESAPVDISHPATDTTTDPASQISSFQLYDMISEMKQMMNGLHTMQQQQLEQRNRQTKPLDQSGPPPLASTPPPIVSVGFGGSLDSNATAATASKTTPTATTTTATPAIATAPGETKEATEPPKKRKNTAFEKNLVMINLRAKLKQRGKSAKKRVKAERRRKTSQHFAMAASNFRRKTDMIDLKIMQGDARSLKQIRSPGLKKSRSRTTNKYALPGAELPGDAEVALPMDEESDTKTRSQPGRPTRKRTRRLSTSSLGAVAGKLQRQKSIINVNPNAAADIASRRQSLLQTPKKPSFCARTVIHPYNPWHTAWDFFVCCILMVVMWFLPLNLAFDEVSELTRGLSVLIDLIFAVDMFKQFRTGYITDEEDIVMDSWAITKHYLSTWFVADFVTVVPIEAIVTAIIEGNSPSGVGTGPKAALQATKSLKMLRLIRIAKLVRLMRVSRAFRYIRFAKAIIEDTLKIEIPSALIKLTRLLLLIIMVCHWGACMNYFVCKMYNYPPESWIALANIQDLPLYKKYSWCFLKAGGSFVGVGFGGNPVSSTSCSSTSDWCEIESWVQFIQLTVGRVYYALLVAEVSGIIAKMDIARSAFETQMHATNVYMRAKKLSPELKDKIRDYMRARYKDGRMIDEAAVLSSLSSTLKSEVMACCAQELSVKVPWLRNNPNLHTQVSAMAVPHFGLDGDVLLKQGDLGHHVFIISQGVVELYRTYTNAWGSRTEPILMRAIGDGCTFGIVSVVLNIRIGVTAIAKGNVMMYSITVEKFKKLLLNNPESSTYFDFLAKFRRKKYENGNTNKANDNGGTSSDEEDDEEDPEDSKTELFQLSLQLANMEDSSDLLSSLKDEQTQHYKNKGKFKV